MSEIMTVCVPSKLKDKAKDLRINVSLVCRTALQKEVQMKERENRGKRRQAIHPGHHSNRRAI
jgi:post-segregation antitoxin (ccd killing protein)